MVHVTGLPDVLTEYRATVPPAPTAQPRVLSPQATPNRSTANGAGTAVTVISCESTRNADPPRPTVQKVPLGSTAIERRSKVPWPVLISFHCVRAPSHFAIRPPVPQARVIVPAFATPYATKRVLLKTPSPTRSHPIPLSRRTQLSPTAKLPPRKGDDSPYSEMSGCRP